MTGEAVGSPEPPPRRLVPWEAGDRRFAAICLALLALGLGIGIPLFPRAFPEAGLELATTREESRRQAAEILEGYGLRVREPGGRTTSRFSEDGDARVFLERTIGLEAANLRIREQSLPIWGFEHRWFVPERKEEWRATVSPSGRLISWEHVIAEGAEGACLERDAARELASAELSRRLPPAERLRLREITSESIERPSRQDHRFELEDPETAVGDGAVRIEVGVAGDQVVSYRRWYRVPEEFRESYRTLRSKNEAAGIVASLGFGVLMLALVGALVGRLRQPDLPGKLALGFAAVAGVLSAGSALNSLGSYLHDYDTTTTFAAFSGQICLSILAQTLLFGGWVYVLLLGGEPEDAEVFGSRRLALRGLFTPRGLATKEIPRGVLLGFALAALFVAYQAVFYLVADRFGAWSPAETPYTDLLETRFPFLAVLFTGFIPAVTEELLFRLFAISFLYRLTRRPWLSILLPAFVWGFAHSAYPNQPFFIRGLEVGIAGVIVGLVYRRFGAFPVLVWHYTIDAAYTALLLFRSPNPAFVTAAAAASFVLAIPLVLAFVLARRRGGFEDTADVILDSAPPPRRTGTFDAVRDESPLFPALRPALAPAAVALALVLAAARFLPGAADREVPKAAITASRAEEISRRFVAAHGDTGATRRAGVHPAPELVPDVAAKLIREGGSAEKLPELAAGRSLFQVRLFRPLDVDEWRLGVSADGRVTGFIHDLPETEAGARLDSEEAESLLRTEMAKLGDESGGWLRVSSSVEQKKARSEASFELRNPEPIARLSTGEWAELRRSYRISGDRLSTRRERIHLPESYTTRRSHHDAAWVLRVALQVLLVSFLLGTVILLALRAARSGLRWGPVLLSAAAFGIALRIGDGNRWSSVLVTNYDTSTPWSVFLVSWVTGEIGSVLMLGAGALLVLLAAERTIPGAGDLRRWRAGAADAIGAVGLGPLLALLALGGAAALRSAAEARWPESAPARAVAPIAELAGPAPILSILAQAFGAVLVLGGGALALGELRRRFPLPNQSIVVVLFAISPILTSHNAITPSEWLLSSATTFVLLLTGWAAAEQLLGGNPWSWILLGAGGRLTDGGVSLALQEAPAYRWQGYLAAALGLFLLLLPLLLKRRAVTGLGQPVLAADGGRGI